MLKHFIFISLLFSASIYASYQPEKKFVKIYTGAQIEVVECQDANCKHRSGVAQRVEQDGIKRFGHIWFCGQQMQLHLNEQNRVVLKQSTEKSN